MMEVILREETVSYILNVEHDALGLYEDAKTEAAHLIEEAKKTAERTRQQALSAAQHKAEQIIAQGRQKADGQHADIIAHAGADAQSLETMSTRHFDEAVQLVVHAVIGRE